MEKINRNNYEAYFMDYLEGNLNSRQEDDLRVFLKNNPDLKQELDEFKNIPLIEEDILYPNKDALKKQLTISEQGYTIFDELSIASLEGELSESQTSKFYQFMEDFPDKKKEYAQYEKTVLKPDKKLRYPDKSDLKKGKSLPLYRHSVYRYWTLAASVLLLIGLYFFLPDAKEIPYNDALNKPSKNFDNKWVSEFLSSHSVPDRQEHNINIDHSSIEYNKLSSQLLNENGVSESNMTNKEESEEVPEPIQTKYRIQISVEPVYAGIIEPSELSKDFQIGNRRFNSYDKATRFLAKTLEDPIKKNLSERNFSLWEIADLGFKGISELTGKKVVLERYYDERGDLARLALQTESFRLSTDLKK